MVAALSALRTATTLAASKTGPPVMRYTRDDTLTGVIGVRSRLFGVRRRLVRLERGMLHIHAKGDDCGEPLFSTRVCDAHEVVVDPAKSTLSLRSTSRIIVLLVFKHDTSLLHLWANAIRRAHRNTIESHYKLCRVIGSGHYAKVYEAFDRHTGDKVAVKVIPKKTSNPKFAQYYKREADIARIVNHPNIVSTYDVFETATHLYIVMEHVEHGNLLQFLAAGKNRVNEKNALRIAKQLLQAIAYLHDNDIVHRDIKAENILITSNGTIKLADFGLARRLFGVSSDGYCLSSILGTPAYCSPEVIRRLPYGKPVDIFGCGVLLFIALSGALPFRGDTPREVFENIVAGRIAFPPARWGMVSQEARRFVTRLLNVTPHERPTAASALKHPWLRLSGDRDTGGGCPVSPRPFVRNSSARTSYGRKPNSGQFTRVASTTTFRRAQSGSLHQLTLDKMRQRLGPNC